MAFQEYRVKTGDLIITESERNRILEVLDSGNISEGKNCREFEKSWAEYIGTEYCTVLNSGTSALIVGLTALNHILGKNLKIATTPFTYIATINAILMTGNTPVFVDVDRDTYGMSPEKLEPILAIENIDVVLPVHIMGVPCRIIEIKQLCNKYDVLLAEDNCQSYGTRNVDGKMLGSYGMWSACSFFIAHTLQCSELGSLNTNVLDLQRVFDKLKSNGRTSMYDVEWEDYYVNKMEDDDRDLHPRYYHDMVSGNYRTTEFSGALANAQFENIDSVIKKRNENVKYLIDNLKKYSDVIQLPIYTEDIAYLGFPLMILKPDLISRREFRQHLEDNGIETRPMYGCLPFDMPSLKQFKDKYKNKLKNTEYVGRQTFYVGCHQYLTKNDLNYMISVFDQILSGVN